MASAGTSSAQRAALVALGLRLAASTRLVVVSLGLTALAACAVVVLALGKTGAAWHDLPSYAALAFAWSGGVMIAFGSSLQAMDRDARSGILDLVRARGIPMSAYADGRVAGLVALLAGALGLAVLAAGVASLSVVHPGADRWRATAAALAYVGAFSLTLGPVAMATLAASTRAGGYLAFLVVLVVPELVSPWTARALPPGCFELTSIPAALDALRALVRSPSENAVHGARAAVFLAALIVAAWALVRVRAQRGEREGRA